MHLEKSFKKSDRTSTAPDSKFPASQSSMRPPRGGRLLLPKLEAGNSKRMSETAGNFNKRQASVDMQLDYEKQRH
jgi:hypothetical protein